MQPQSDHEPLTGSGSTHTQSFIDASLTIVGDLHSEGDVRMDGRICGNVRCAQLIVGRGAAITGTVAANEAIVRGNVTGKIRAATVIIQDTAHVESEITYRLLAIDQGSVFEGSACHSDNPLKEEPSTSPLAELQQVALLAAEGTPNSGCKQAGAGDGAKTAAAVVEAPATGGKAARAPAASGPHSI